MEEKRSKTNKEQWRRLRKSRSNLLVAGKAVLAFGVWTMMKLLLELFLGENNFGMSIDETMGGTIEIQAAVVIGVFVIIGLIAVFIHFIIYRGAVREGRGKKGGFFYLLVAFIFIVFTIVSITYTVTHSDLYAGQRLRFYSSILFDLALLISCTDVFYNGIMCKRLKKTLKNSEETA